METSKSAQLHAIFKPVSGILLMIPISLLSLPFLIGFWIYSRIAFLLIWLKFGKNWTRPNGQDICMGIDRHNSKPHCSSGHRFKGKIDIPAFIENFDNILQKTDESGELKYGRLQQRYENHYGYDIFRKDLEFDVKRHIKVITLQELFPEIFEETSLKFDKELRVLGGDHTKHLPDIPFEKLYERFCNKFVMLDFELNRPQWWIYFIEEKDNHFTYGWIANHAITDGINYSLFFKKEFQQPPVSYEDPNYGKCNLRRILHNIRSFSMIPYTGPIIFQRFKKNPLHGPELSGKKMFIQSKPIDGSRLKNIRKTLNVNFTTILLTCLSNALRLNFKKKNAKVVDVKVYITGNSLDLTRPVRIQNSFNLLSMKLENTNDEGKCLILDDLNWNSSETVDRLKRIQDSFLMSKNNPAYDALIWVIMNVFGILPTRLIDCLYNPKGHTAALSNIPIEQKTVRAFGCEQVAIGFSTPDRCPFGLSVATIGYKNELRIGLTVDRTLIPNEEAHEFVENFIKGLEDLEKELNVSEVKKIEEKKII